MSFKFFSFELFFFFLISLGLFFWPNRDLTLKWSCWNVHTWEVWWLFGLLLTCEDQWFSVFFSFLCSIPSCVLFGYLTFDSTSLFCPSAMSTPALRCSFFFFCQSSVIFHRFSLYVTSLFAFFSLQLLPLCVFFVVCFLLQPWLQQ